MTPTTALCFSQFVFLVGHCPQGKACRCPILPPFFPSPSKAAGRGAGTTFTFSQSPFRHTCLQIKVHFRCVCLTTPGRACRKPTQLFSPGASFVFFCRRFWPTSETELCMGFPTSGYGMKDHIISSRMTHFCGLPMG